MSCRWNFLLAGFLYQWHLESITDLQSVIKAAMSRIIKRPGGKKKEPDRYGRAPVYFPGI
jgi:hypothetical protein